MGNLALIHTVPPLIEVFNKLCADLLPGVQVMHILIPKENILCKG